MGNFAYIDESAESEVLLAAFCEKGLTPLFHWQPREHFDRKYAITHRDLPDGYLMDNRVWKPYAENVIPKCVPSIQM